MKFIDIHTHEEKSDENVFSIVNKFPNATFFSDTQAFSIGIHPWYIDRDSLTKELIQIEQKLQLPNCLAIGECGLDKTIQIDLNLQTQVFRAQVELSEKYQKPIIIHCVKAFNELVVLKKQWKPKQTWIVHGFRKNLPIAKSLIEHKIYISIGANLLYNEKLQQTIQHINPEKIVLETDNAEESIQKIYNKFAEIRKQDLPFIQKQITKNFNSIFHV